MKVICINGIKEGNKSSTTGNRAPKEHEIYEGETYTIHSKYEDDAYFLVERPKDAAYSIQCFILLSDMDEITIKLKREYDRMERRN